MYKVISTNYARLIFVIFFNDHNSSYFLRQSDFSIPSYNTVTCEKHSLCYLGPRLWGKLSIEVGSAKTLNLFENKIRTYDISLSHVAAPVRVFSIG